MGQQQTIPQEKHSSSDTKTEINVSCGPHNGSISEVVGILISTSPRAYSFYLAF